MTRLHTYCTKLRSPNTTASNTTTTISTDLSGIANLKLINLRGLKTLGPRLAVRLWHSHSSAEIEDEAG